MTYRAEYRYVCHHIKDGEISTEVFGDWVKRKEDVKIVPHRNQLGESCSPAVVERVLVSSVNDIQ
jgi:hypothetical protein